MQVKVDAIANGFTITYWLDGGKTGQKGSYVTEFTGDWDATISKLRTMVLIEE